MREHVLELARRRTRCRWGRGRLARSGGRDRWSDLDLTFGVTDGVAVIAERVGVNPKTIRFYESIGVIPEPPRTTGDTETTKKATSSAFKSSERRNASA